MQRVAFSGIAGPILSEFSDLFAWASEAQPGRRSRAPGGTRASHSCRASRPVEDVPAPPLAGVPSRLMRTNHCQRPPCGPPGRL
jgi:hypothetical protein